MENKEYIMGIEFERFMELLFVYFFSMPLSERYRILGEATTERFKQETLEGGR